MNKRYNFIDGLRGFSIINMIIYHLLYDLVYLFNIEFNFFHSIYDTIWQNVIAMTFIVTSGISLNFGKRNFKKIIYLVICAVALSTYTYFFMKSEFIIFGIIHFFAISTIIATLFFKHIDKLNKYLGFILFLVLFISTRYITDGYIGILNSKYPLPNILYKSEYLFWLGFPNASFSSADYFPLIPWFFLFLVGIYAGKIYLSKKPKLKIKSNNPLCFLGRHSLLIYMLHQPIIYIVLSLIFKTKTL